jgi:hypothetical protein
VKWAALALATVAVLALVWIAGEVHYDACVNAAAKQRQVATETQSFLTDYNARIKGCSRLPF